MYRFFSTTSGRKLMSQQDLEMELSNPAKWKLTRKNNYSVWLSRPQIGTRTYNQLEDCEYETTLEKQFILSGTRGEQWVIDINKLMSTYTWEDGTPITPESLVIKFDANGILDWSKIKVKDTGRKFTHACFHLPLCVKNFPVKTSWGETLIANRDGIDHDYGDYLLCAIDVNHRPNLNDIWVVNGCIFVDTYNKMNIINGNEDVHDAFSAKKPTGFNCKQ